MKMKRRVNNMDLLSRNESLKAYNRFMKRLENDERLMKIIEENNININYELYFPLDSASSFKSIGIKYDLAKHLYNKNGTQLLDIEFDIHERAVRRDKGGFDLVLDVDCYMRYGVKHEMPKLVEIEDEVKFEFNDGITGTSNMGRITAKARFTVGSLQELVSYMFAIMHKALDENER
jgi:hypothetical protein